MLLNLHPQLSKGKCSPLKRFKAGDSGSKVVFDECLAIIGYFIGLFDRFDVYNLNSIWLILIGPDFRLVLVLLFNSNLLKYPLVLRHRLQHLNIHLALYHLRLLATLQRSKHLFKTALVLDHIACRRYAFSLICRDILQHSFRRHLFNCRHFPNTTALEKRFVILFTLKPGFIMSIDHPVLSLDHLVLPLDHSVQKLECTFLLFFSR